PYDATRPLIIDPVLVYSTYLGGSEWDVGKAVAMDAAGNTYVTGYTFSPDFPTLNGLGAPPDRLSNPFTDLGGEVVFVTKLDPTGTVVYSTFLGGSGVPFLASVAGDAGQGIVVDAAGEAYVTGLTNSVDFPTVNALQSHATDPGGPNGFLFKLNAAGSGL